ncbi:hypothetical protein [Achromobacter aloeverae]|uniref:Uncharacterized protein n=1 Tax=Achromobacter aloeverae TaxID=1750518 RepID=A0A4Q1HJ78_9BURK|nr:hypothetical protein [Achromobacter aloeverae]RXN90144.1 hypothetical protein C7R54_11435 [Achromobacter aloeverae]
MSWRALFATLLVALCASAWGGIQFGDWLVAYAPGSSPTNETTALAQPLPRDEHGEPLLSWPPQPLVDGTMGVPERPAPPNWHVSRQASLFNGPHDPLVQISRRGVDLSQARRIAAEILAARTAGMNADAAYPQLHAADDVIPQTALQTMDMPSGKVVVVPTSPRAVDTPHLVAAAGPGVPGAVMERTVLERTPLPDVRLVAVETPSLATTPPDWRDALRHELSQCASRGFFQRPTCAWAARNRYCGPNQAWGTMRECPRKVE